MVDGESAGILKRETEDHVQRWGYESHFREYTFLLGRKGKEALESIDNFPSRIELDPSWREALDKIRAETKSDGNERFSMVGFREDSRDFYFPEVAGVGEPHQVAKAVKGDLFWGMWKKHKITSVVGDFHTHPSGSPFSVQDLYGFLNRLTAPQPFIRGLANEKENIFAFRTRETFMVSEIDTPQKRFSDVFKDHWLEVAGYKYSEDRSHVIQINTNADMWKANIGIAEAHRLALYKGRPNEDLVRIDTGKGI
jgi:hypothetical protein